ncbi:hypothetical protein HDU96_006625 [Phlyctochytrium bullatum]|nr:hypothetical protein HDU96_006625 [Phlyctochytrium bullatum]
MAYRFNKMTLMDLPDSVLFHLLEEAPNVTSLARTCRRLRALWSVPSVRANWLLRVTSSRRAVGSGKAPAQGSSMADGGGGRVEALDVAISLLHDLHVAANLVDRSHFSPGWLAHVLIDAIRGEPPPKPSSSIRTAPTHCPSCGVVLARRSKPPRDRSEAATGASSSACPNEAESGSGATLSVEAEVLNLLNRLHTRKSDGNMVIVQGRCDGVLPQRYSAGGVSSADQGDVAEDAENPWMRHPFHPNSNVLFRSGQDADGESEERIECQGCGWSEANVSPTHTTLPAVKDGSTTEHEPEDSLAVLARSMIRAGADLELDVSLYLRSVLLMGGGPISSMSAPDIGSRRRTTGASGPGSLPRPTHAGLHASSSSSATGGSSYTNAGPSTSHSSTGGVSGGIAVAGPTILSWILNESLRSSIHQGASSPSLTLDPQRPGRKGGGGVVTCGLAALILAAGSGHAGACRALMTWGGVDPRGLDDLVICVACHGGWKDVVRLLLDFGSDPRARDGMPARVARLADRPDIVAMLNEASFNQRR